MSISSATRDTILTKTNRFGRDQKKAIVRTAFDAALGPEFHEMIQETKQMEKAIQQSADL
jgi:hypothetical protein